MRRTTAGLALLVSLLAGAQLAAQSAGEAEYMNYCAACHGESGTGDGPIAGLMTVEVPDLTTISARNDGRFPMLDVIEVIDGRTGVRGHGYPMPVWGDRFGAEHADMGTFENEITVRGRVLSLATYLQSLQE